MSDNVQVMEESPPEQPQDNAVMEEEASSEQQQDADVGAVVAAAAQAAAACMVDVPSTTGPRPNDRDVILGEGSAGHKTNLLLQDMMRLYRIFWKLEDKKSPETVQEAMPIAEMLHKLITNGKEYELAGIKDVPKPFLKSTGRFLEKLGPDEWSELDDDKAKEALAKAMIAEFRLDDLGDLTQSPFVDLKAMMARDAAADEATDAMPNAKDAILFPVGGDEATKDRMYEHQGGNKTIFSLASQLVTTFTNSSEKRVEAALAMLKGLEEADVHEEHDEKFPVPVAKKTPRFLVRQPLDADGLVSWSYVNAVGAAEFAIIFVFEVYLEKEIHILSTIATAGLDNIGAVVEGFPVPANGDAGTIPIDEPTEHDVLFGRGGMTNSHVGNRRFRDIIALHRPDYIRAIKMDKPGVAKKIVKAIRTGDPPGRFLKKGDDGKWYDVGDRTAAEKTSQGLRERTNAEKRQRSSLREALRIRKQDMVEPEDTPDAKRAKTSSESGTPGAVSEVASPVPTLNYIGTNLAVPLSLNMKEHKVKKKEVRETTSLGVGELVTEGLPPGAVDEEGNPIVTDYDILCGRGGLTNHHKGNKRFRDIVALHRPDYVRAPKIQKPSVARVIVRAIQNGDPPGRFLRKDEKTGKWVDVGDKKAAEKTSQALREKTNEERDKDKEEPPLLGLQILLPNPAQYLAAVSGAPLLIPGIQQPSIAMPVAQPKGEESEAKEGEENATEEKVKAKETTASAEKAAEEEAKAEETSAAAEKATEEEVKAEETTAPDEEEEPEEEEPLNTQVEEELNTMSV